MSSFSFFINSFFSCLLLILSPLFYRFLFLPFFINSCLSISLLICPPFQFHQFFLSFINSFSSLFLQILFISYLYLFLFFFLISSFLFLGKKKNFKEDGDGFNKEDCNNKKDEQEGWSKRVTKKEKHKTRWYIWITKQKEIDDKAKKQRIIKKKDKENGRKRIARDEKGKWQRRRIMISKRCKNRNERKSERNFKK